MFAGHRSDIFLPCYASAKSTIDGGANAFGKKPRPIINDIFRGMSLQWFHLMEQSLPANVQAELAQREDFVQVSDEILALNETLRTLTLRDKIEALHGRRDELYRLKRHLISDELSKWQIAQSHTANNPGDSVADRITHFNRIRRLNPPRDQLSTLLFLSVPLRSKEGRSAVRNMITLYRDTGRVAYRPSLQPHEGRCPVGACGKDMEELVCYDQPS